MTTHFQGYLRPPVVQFVRLDFHGKEAMVFSHEYALQHPVAPSFELLDDIMLSAPRLESEGVPCQIDELLPLLALRNVNSSRKWGEWVSCVHFVRKTHAEFSFWSVEVFITQTFSSVLPSHFHRELLEELHLGFFSEVREADPAVLVFLHREGKDNRSCSAT